MCIRDNGPPFANPGSAAACMPFMLLLATYTSVLINKVWVLCVQKNRQSVTESTTGEYSEEEYVDDTEEVDVRSSVPSIDESVLKEDDTDDDHGTNGTNVTEESTSSSGRGRKRAKTTEKGDSSSILPLKKDIGKLVNTSAQVIQQIAAHRADKDSYSYGSQQEHDEDKDWIFAKLIYGKMMQIPDSFAKDDLQIEILKLINDARRRNEKSAHSLPADYPAQEYRYTQGPVHVERQPYSSSQYSAATTSDYQNFPAQPQLPPFSGQLASSSRYPSSSYTVPPRQPYSYSEYTVQLRPPTTRAFLISLSWHRSLVRWLHQAVIRHQSTLSHHKLLNQHLNQWNSATMKICSVCENVTFMCSLDRTA